MRQAAWYQTVLPTFSDALAQVRRCLWKQLAFCMSAGDIDKRKPPTALFEHFGEMLAYAASGDYPFEIYAVKGFSSGS